MMKTTVTMQGYGMLVGRPTDQLRPGQYPRAFTGPIWADLGELRAYLKASQLSTPTCSVRWTEPTILSPAFSEGYELQEITVAGESQPSASFHRICQPRDVMLFAREVEQRLRAGGYSAAADQVRRMINEQQ